MYYIAVLAPDNQIVQASSPSLLYGLDRFKAAWNEHVQRFNLVRTITFEPSKDFDIVQFHSTFNRIEHRWIITSSKMAWECFIDTAADEAYGG